MVERTYKRIGPEAECCARLGPAKRLYLITNDATGFHSTSRLTDAQVLQWTRRGYHVTLVTSVAMQERKPGC